MATLTGFSSAAGALQLTAVGPYTNPLAGGSSLSVPSAGYTRTLSYTYGTGAGTLGSVYNVNQMAMLSRSVAASGSDTLTLSALAGTASPTTLYDVLNQATPAFARINGMLLELLTTNDSSGNSGPTPTLASSITVGNAAANAWTAIILSTGTIGVQNAASFQFVTRSAAGFVVSSGSSDQLKILNADGALAAIYRLVIFGAAT